MRWQKLNHLLFVLGSGGLLMGGSCVNGEDVQNAFSDSLIAVLSTFFTAILETALSSFIQI